MKRCSWQWRAGPTRYRNSADRASASSVVDSTPQHDEVVDQHRLLTVRPDCISLDGLSVRGATLEDVFLQLTGREYRS